MYSIRKKMMALAAAALCFMSLAAGCAAPAASSGAKAGRFQEIKDELFIESVSSDAISAHYLLKNPGEYGVILEDYTFGRISLEDSETSVSKAKALVAELEAIDDDALSDDDQLTKEILIDSLERSIPLNEHVLLQEPVNPLSGQQAMLPILLNEYTFYNEEDISHYLELLEDTGEYFESILGFEQEKAKAGTFMTEEILDKVLAQCKNFIKTPESNLMITTFEGKLDRELPGLSASAKNNAVQKNRAAVINYVIPAYENLAAGLEALRGSCSENGALSSFDGGKEYYSALVRDNTGTDMAPEELSGFIEEKMQETITEMAMIAMTSPETVQAVYSNKVTENFGTPEDILSQLQTLIKEDFPAAADVTYEVKYVDKALRDYLSPAFYLTPPLDAFKENTIYINGEQGEEVKNIDNIFTTLAHEGFPGHLYQTTYFLNTKPDKLRSVLNYSGYTEGWATYIELLAYDWAYEDKKTAAFLKANQELSLLLSARIDIGIHDEGWSKQEVGDYMLNQGFSNDETIVGQLYDIILQSPGNYLSYAVGGEMFKELRDKASDALGTKFNASEFHRFLLDFGPASFTIIEKHLDNWIKSQ